MMQAYCIFHYLCEQSAESEWQKVDILLEFGGWLYSQSFPRAEALQPVQAAIDLLLPLEEPGQEAEKGGAHFSSSEYSP